MITKRLSCATCSQERQCRDSANSWIFFLIGLVATFSVRLVVVFMKHNLAYAKAAWYIGVLGFFIFFLYKFNVDRARSRFIASNRLAEKVRGKEAFSDRDYALMSEVLCSLSSNKDKINYFIIFSTSLITFLFAVYEDFFR